MWRHIQAVSCSSILLHLIKKGLYIGEELGKKPTIKLLAEISLCSYIKGVLEFCMTSLDK